MVAATDNKRRYNNNLTMHDKRAMKSKQFKDFENMPCPMHPKSGHKIKDCHDFINRYKGVNRYNNNSDRKNEERKDEQKKAEGDFQEPREQLNVIFSGVPGARSKQQQKLAHRTIMASEPTTP